MNKGYAFGFLIILLVVILGLYVAFTGFMSSREALHAQPVQASAAKTVQPTRSPIKPSPTISTTLILIPTSIPEVITPTFTVSIGIPEPSFPPTEAPVLAATEPPPSQPIDTPISPVQPPTPVPIPSYPFRLAGPPAADPGFPPGYIFGTIRDAAGNGLEGVQVHVASAWTPPWVAVSKGGVDLGKYDVLISRDVLIWDVFLVDAGGNQISTKVQVQFDPNVGSAFRVDWQRTY